MTNEPTQRVLIIFQELLKGKRLTITAMERLLLEKNYPVKNRRTIIRDVQVLSEVCPLVEWEMVKTAREYFIDSELRRLNYF